MNVGPRVRLGGSTHERQQGARPEAPFGLRAPCNRINHMHKVGQGPPCHRAAAPPRTRLQAAIDAIDVTCGLSLGEYTALAFADAMRWGCEAGAR